MRKRSLVCTLVLRKPPKTGFLTSRPISILPLSILIHVKMPTIFSIFPFMSRINFMLNWFEHEKHFITMRPELAQPKVTYTMSPCVDQINYWRYMDCKCIEKHFKFYLLYCGVIYFYLEVEKISTVSSAMVIWLVCTFWLTWNVNHSHFACWVIFYTFAVVCWLFSKLTFSKNSFRNTISVSNSLDPDQARHSVGPDLDPNCLQRLSADNKSRGSEDKS